MGPSLRNPNFYCNAFWGWLFLVQKWVCFLFLRRSFLWELNTWRSSEEVRHHRKCGRGVTSLWSVMLIKIKKTAMNIYNSSFKTDYLNLYFYTCIFSWLISISLVLSGCFSCFMKIPLNVWNVRQIFYVFKILNVLVLFELRCWMNFVALLHTIVSGVVQLTEWITVPSSYKHVRQKGMAVWQ